MSTRLQDHYQQVVRANLQKELKLENAMQVPRLAKIVINMGIGESVADSKVVDIAAKELALISGQRPIITKARRSVSNFKLREGMRIGCKVTLRRDRMYEFLDRLVTIALPRTRDFRGLSGNSFDGRGNYAVGLKEQIVFPEIEYDTIDAIRGMDIVICTTARNDAEGKELLRAFEMPFAN